ncbi:MAG: 4,5:9,10-diseco-3-hydroxy-5,9,17-trioxoandrosta-1(10),2-diene-4-oate hydrolase [Smithella sp. PtaU1.Bin162]|nr:MAG: 4,5:9,10-diseco-3-hydroxy-5,9,17-trioxoandrosta-1(10),2-diene-4-oate hydrolase [Smithella sp. PtaU1.Bin162]
MIKKFKVENIEMACWINPEDFGAHKQTLVFIHGSGSDHTCWVHQYPELHKKFNVVAVDLPGHGQSGGHGESEVDKYAHWIKKLLDVIKLSKPVLIGHSLGAATTLKFALHYPQVAGGIVPVGSGIKMPVNQLLRDGIRTNKEEAINIMCTFSLFKETRPKFFEELKKNLSDADVESFSADLTACNNLDLTDDIAKINTPALFICGAVDKMTPPDFSRKIAASIPGAKVCVIEKAGHVVMIEKPEEVNKAISEFASSLS